MDKSKVTRFWPTPYRQNYKKKNKPVHYTIMCSIAQYLDIFLLTYCLNAIQYIFSNTRIEVL